MASHHDSLFHRTFSDPANAAAMFRCALPAALVAAIDWSTLTELTSKFTDPELRKHFPDNLYSVRLREHDFLLFLVPEHKSEDDPDYVLQKLRYAVNIWSKWAEEHPHSDGLPPIIPVLFHHGNQPWHSPTSLLGHFDAGGLAAVRAKDPELAAIIASNGVSLVASVLDLAVRDEEWLRTTAFPDIARLVLLCMRFVRFQGPAEGAATLLRWRDLVAAVHRAPRGQGGLTGVESYLLEITDLTIEQLHEVVQRAIDTGEDMIKFTSTADRLRQEGQVKGEALGEARGEARGEVRGRTVALLRLLERRFGDVPDRVVQRVHAAEVTELDHWIDCILDARTIDEVFAAP